MDEIFFSSRLTLADRADLEELLFFHPQQRRYEPGIRRSLERFGPPEVKEGAEGVSLQVRSLVETQVLFAFQGSPGGESALVGALLYHRPDEQNISVVHVAVRQWGDQRHRCRLIRRLLVELRRIARLLRGVEWVHVAYTNRRIRVWPGRRPDGFGHSTQRDEAARSLAGSLS